MQTLSIKQINNLITGNILAVEIASTSYDSRAFVVAGAYKKADHVGGASVSKYLNSSDKSETLYWMRKYEIKKEYIENEWYVADDDLTNSFFINGIKDIEQLESELSKYLDDFAVLDVAWNCDNPL